LGLGLPHEPGAVAAHLPLLVAGCGGVGWGVGSSRSSHGAGGLHRLYLPPYSPELNPPERVFEVLRQAVEGQVYPSLQGKRHAIDQQLRRLNANKPQLRALIGWDWIRDAFQQLPNPDIRSP
jgi:transposase